MTAKDSRDAEWAACEYVSQPTGILDPPVCSIKEQFNDDDGFQQSDLSKYPLEH